ncbi:hypothetical protein [Methanobrevibacter sp.]|uniref:hypothetical protein n=1 Tax=Methanobrevibacter sp. TaxID=66852 RepID=UPI0025DE28C9|nr:hypothetical protein [Methanobrevibacter sp.]MBR4447274.1 hypothetical protein [Methanobrevibacter sp.]
MSNFKELRSIELSSYTIISTGIAVLFSIISAIFITILVGFTVPDGASVIIYLIPTIIVGTFMYTIYNAFCQGLLYNLLAKKLKTIAIELKDGKEIVKISTTETAMMVSIILTIQAILLYLVSVFVLPLLLSTIMQTLMYSGQQIMAFNVYQLLVLISQPTTIAVFIFGTLIISFVFVLIGTYIYNILGKNDRGIVLNLSEEKGFAAIDSIDSLRFAIAFAIISGVLNLVFAIIMMISGMTLTSAIANVLYGFAGGFIEAYLLAIFYNYLAPKLGKLKIELIDFIIN